MYWKLAEILLKQKKFIIKYLYVETRLQIDFVTDTRELTQVQKLCLKYCSATDRIFSTHPFYLNL